MIKTFLIRAGLFFVLFPLFVAVQAASSAAFSAGSSGESSSCVDRQDSFPDSLYARLDTQKGGSVTGIRIFLSYDNGTCSSLLYASSAGESRIATSYPDDNDDLVFNSR